MWIFPLILSAPKMKFSVVNRIINHCPVKIAKDLNAECDMGYRPLCRNCRSESCGRLGHTPSCVVAHTTCAQCMGSENVDRDTKCNFCGTRCEICDEKNMDGFVSPPCLTCGFREITFSRLETVDHHKNATVIAHNIITSL